MNSILQGFIDYWRGCPISFQIFMMDLFKPIVRIFPAIAEQYTLFCRKTIDKCYPQQWELFKNEARRIVQSLIETGSREPRIIYLAHYFQLEGYFAYYCLNWMLTQSPKKILHLFANYDSNELIQELTNKYITGCIEMKDLKKAEQVIKGLSLDPKKYPSLLEKMETKYLYYQHSNYDIFFIQYNIRHSHSLLEGYCKILLRQNKVKEALHFIAKYKLDGKKIGVMPHILEQQRIFHNILKYKDRFGPTENVIFEEQIPYLTLQQMGYQETDVQWIDSKNCASFDPEKQLAGTQIGFDSESAGGIHAFDQTITVLVQIATPTKVFLFDILSPECRAAFGAVCGYLFANCTIHGQGIVNEISDIAGKYGLEEQAHQARIYDTKIHFKTKLPSESKSSLAHLTSYFLNRQLSKYEQCSGWFNRPLRKTQLHYAALDAVLPLKLAHFIQRTPSKPIQPIPSTQ